MLTKLFELMFKIVPKEKHQLATNIVLLIANILDVLIILMMALFMDKLLIVLYAVIVAMLIRINMGEHYKTWLECAISGLLIYTIYAFASITLGNLFIDIILGIVLAVFMINFKSEKSQRILKWIYGSGNL